MRALFSVRLSLVHACEYEAPYVNVWYMASDAQYGHVVRRQVPFVRSSGAGMRPSTACCTVRWRFAQAIRRAFSISNNWGSFGQRWAFGGGPGCGT